MVKLSYGKNCKTGDYFVICWEFSQRQRSSSVHTPHSSWFIPYSADLNLKSIQFSCRSSVLSRTSSANTGCNQVTRQFHFYTSTRFKIYFLLSAETNHGAKEIAPLLGIQYQFTVLLLVPLDQESLLLWSLWLQVVFPPKSSTLIRTSFCLSYKSLHIRPRPSDLPLAHLIYEFIIWIRIFISSNISWYNESVASNSGVNVLADSY